MYALSVEHVTKTYHSTDQPSLKAVSDLSLKIPVGQIYGLLGPNGAGKSTLISMICGAVKPDPESGEIHIFDKNVLQKPEQAKLLLGIVPQEIIVEPAFTVYEVLHFFSGMYGVAQADRRKRIPEILDSLGLADKMHVKARSLSGGMKRRLMIAKALLHQPRLLILDEPTAGVDVALRQRIWDLVKHLNKQGTTVIFTTHYLEEAEQLCESMTVINKGKVIKEGRVKEIQQEFSQKIIGFELYRPDVVHLDGVRKVGVEFELPFLNLVNDMRKILDHYGDNLKSFRNEAASLEKVFLELTERDNAA
jgi:ABC-2 type transport system ATP-binding protein